MIQVLKDLLFNAVALSEPLALTSLTPRNPDIECFEEELIKSGGGKDNKN